MRSGAEILPSTLVSNTVQCLL